MFLPSKKRIFIILSVVCLICLVIRYLLFNGAISVARRRVAGTPIVVSVYYEALCPDSKHFIVKQLLPTYEKLAPIVDVQLIPYGKATTDTNPDGSYRFDCQHGPVECQANIYHACTAEAVEDMHSRLDVVACMIKDNRLPKEAFLRCAKQSQIENIDLIQKCHDSSHGQELLKLNGDLTHALRPVVKFIPTITLDGSQGRQAAILKDLFGEVCKIAGDTEEAQKLCENV